MASEVHSRDTHFQKLHLLCRICGERSKDSRGKCTPKLCENYAETLQKYYNLNINNDIEGIHSKTLCNKCYRRLLHSKSQELTSGASIENALRDIKRSSVLWTQYDAGVSETSCIVCSTYDEQKKGIRGRQNKILGFKSISQSPSVSDLSSVVCNDNSFLDSSSHDTTPTSVLPRNQTSTPCRPTPDTSHSSKLPNPTVSVPTACKKKKKTVTEKVPDTVRSAEEIKKSGRNKDCWVLLKHEKTK